MASRSDLSEAAVTEFDRAGDPDGPHYLGTPPRPSHSPDEASVDRGLLGELPDSAEAEPPDWREIAASERRWREHAERQRDEAERGRQLALARQLAVQSAALRSRHPVDSSLGILLAVESLLRQPTPDGSHALREWLAFVQDRAAGARAREAVQAVAYSPDGRRIALAGRDGIAHVWVANGSREISRLAHDGPVWAISFSLDGRLVVSGSEDGVARVWETETGREISRLTHGKPIEAVIFSPDGKRVASGGWDNTARVWDAIGGREISRMTHGDWVQALAFSPDGQRVVSGGDDGTARVWDADSGRESARVTHDAPVLAVVFGTVGSVGRLVVSGGEDGRAIVWSADDGRVLTRLDHEDALEALAFTTDGSVVSVGRDGTVRVWTTDGREVLPAPGGEPSGSVGVAASGGREALADDGTNGDHLARTEELIAEARRRLRRNLSREEWARYLGGEPYRRTCPDLP